MYKGLLPKKYQDGGPLRTHPYAKTLQQGGTAQDDEKMKDFKARTESNEDYKKRARLFYYKQILDKELEKKDPTRYANVVNQYGTKRTISEKAALADKLINDQYFNYALNDDEMKTILGDKYADFNTLRSWSASNAAADVSGSGESQVPIDQTKYGLRNSWAIVDPWTESVYNDEIGRLDSSRIKYNPDTNTYTYAYVTSDKPAAKVEASKQKTVQQYIDEFNRPPRAGSRKDGGTLPIMPTKKDSPANIKERFDITKAKDPKVIAGVPKKLIGEQDGYKIYEVDDDYVKVNLYEDFTEGGNPEAYPEFVPPGEIWVASDKTPQNIADIVDHEITEANLMKHKGLKYDDAHIKANRVEMNRRIKERPGLLVTKKTFKKGGKVGNPENRDKPGGSNVGKYSKSEGPFAGPSGGAPAGSYPIGSKARGKSALKLAHNAPNPEGIKKAVYRKYPDLKPGKAARGSKLGMNETGVLQGSYPAAPPAKRYLLVKKTKPNYATIARNVKK